MWSKVVTAALLAIALGSIIEARDFHNLRCRGSPALATDEEAKKEVLTTWKSKTKDKCHARPERCPETKRFYNDKTSGIYLALYLLPNPHSLFQNSSLNHFLTSRSTLVRSTAASYLSTTATSPKPSSLFSSRSWENVPTILQFGSTVVPDVVL